jgi:hypothetical protein
MPAQAEAQPRTPTGSRKKARKLHLLLVCWARPRPRLEFPNQPLHHPGRCVFCAVSGVTNHRSCAPPIPIPKSQFPSPPWGWARICPAVGPAAQSFPTNTSPGVGFHEQQRSTRPSCIPSRSSRKVTKPSRITLRAPGQRQRDYQARHYHQPGQREPGSASISEDCAPPRPPLCAQPANPAGLGPAHSTSTVGLRARAWELCQGCPPALACNRLHPLGALCPADVV